MSNKQDITKKSKESETSKGPGSAPAVSNVAARKSILKRDSVLIHAGTSGSSETKKETKWDETNIEATLHPEDKEYGHMKIDEPKTPFERSNSSEALDSNVLDSEDLATKLLKSGDSLPKVMQDSGSDEDEDLHKQFEQKRKEHYYNEMRRSKEFLAKELDTEDKDEDEDEDDDVDGNHKEMPVVPPNCNKPRIIYSTKNIKATPLKPKCNKSSASSNDSKDK